MEKWLNCQVAACCLGADFGLSVLPIAMASPFPKVTWIWMKGRDPQGAGPVGRGDGVLGVRPLAPLGGPTA